MRTATALIAVAAVLVAALVFVVMIGARPELPATAEDATVHDLQSEVRDLRTAGRGLSEEVDALRRGNEELVSRVAELQRRKAAKAEAASTPAKATVKGVAGSWDHSVAGGDAARVTFTDDGVVHAPGGEGTWTLSGTALELRWRRAGAPGGEWIDTCALSADGENYVGENQNGVVVRGRRRHGD